MINSSKDFWTFMGLFALIGGGIMALVYKLIRWFMERRRHG